MTYKDLLLIVSKPWVNTNDIMKIAQCGRNSATKIRIEIENSIIETGKKLPISSKKHVPTQLLLEYLGLDINYIKAMSTMI